VARIWNALPWMSYADHARERRFEVLVMLCPDRLAHKYAHQVLVLEEFTRAGVEVQFASDRSATRRTINWCYRSRVRSRSTSGPRFSNAHGAADCIELGSANWDQAEFRMATAPRPRSTAGMVGSGSMNRKRHSCARSSTGMRKRERRSMGCFSS
jgi:hypothetical protein